MACITAVYCFAEKGKPGELQKEAHFIAGKGMEGDRHADGGEKQVTLLSGEVRQWMRCQEVPGLCFKRYKANLETDGLKADALKSGTRMRIGTALFEVAASAKVCFSECSLKKEGAECKLSLGGLYLKVAESGIVKPGDTIIVLS